MDEPLYDEAVGPKPITRRRVHDEWDDPTWVAVDVRDFQAQPQGVSVLRARQIDIECHHEPAPGKVFVDTRSYILWLCEWRCRRCNAREQRWLQPAKNGRGMLYTGQLPDGWSSRPSGFRCRSCSSQPPARKPRRKSAIVRKLERMASESESTYRRVWPPDGKHVDLESLQVVEDG